MEKIEWMKVIECFEHHEASISLKGQPSTGADRVIPKQYKT